LLLLLSLLRCECQGVMNAMWVGWVLSHGRTQRQIWPDVSQGCREGVSSSRKGQQQTRASQEENGRWGIIRLKTSELLFFDIFVSGSN
jgi:hypothetical protein